MPWVHISKEMEGGALARAQPSPFVSFVKNVAVVEEVSIRHDACSC